MVLSEKVWFLTLFFFIGTRNYWRVPLETPERPLFYKAANGSSLSNSNSARYSIGSVRHASEIKPLLLFNADMGHSKVKPCKPSSIIKDIFLLFK